VAEGESDKDRRCRADDKTGNAHLAEEFAEDDDQKEEEDRVKDQRHNDSRKWNPFSLRTHRA